MLGNAYNDMASFSYHNTRGVTDMDMRLDPYESRLDKVSIKSWNAQIHSICNRGDCHKLELCCSPNPAYVSPFPFRSSPWFLIKTRVHASPRSKQDGQELKSELTWWLSLRARARVRGPAIGTGVGVDASLVLMSSSSRTRFGPFGDSVNLDAR
jgi:hypothetical protein